MIWLSFLFAQISLASTKSCDVALARHLLDPPRTYLLEPSASVHASMSRLRFLEHVLRLRRVSSEFRPRREPGQTELILNLHLRQIGPEKLWARNQAVVRFVEEEITYDRLTGTTGRGNHGGDAVRPTGVWFRFTLDANASFIPALQREFHDKGVPLIEDEIDRINREAEVRFGRRLLSKLHHVYPGEYEADLAPEITAEELGMVIGRLAEP